jgi:hypothetical protein
LALIVFLKGINVGGHRRLRPTLLAERLLRVDVVRSVVSIGAAGTFAVRGRVGRSDLQAEIRRGLPFEAEVIICGGRELLDLVRIDPFADHPERRGVVRFVSVTAKRPRRPPPLPEAIPTDGRWGVRVLGRRGPFVFGLYRREMNVIGQLGRLEQLVGAPIATRSWSTILSVANAL